MTEAGWTREKPTKEGHYWYRSINDKQTESVVWVAPNMGVFSAFYHSRVEHLDGEWLGPLSPTDRQQGRVAGAQDVLESFKKHHDACNDFRHCECAGGFWYEHIGKAWMDEKAAQAAQDEKDEKDEKGVGDGNIKMS